MSAKPYYTSNKLIEAVKRKISMPVYQTTMSEEDILAFANEEMMISQVPSVMEFHEEYFVFSVDIELEQSKNRYQIPDRAVGMKLRDICFVDSNNNIFEMTRILAEDKSFFNRNISNSTNVHKFYLEGNDVVLTPDITSVPNGGRLRFFIYLRPNQLVKDERAAVIQSFRQTLSIIDNSVIVAGQDSIVLQNVTFVPVTSSPQTNEFVIGATATDTATNLAAAINSSQSLKKISAVASGTSVLISSTNKFLKITYSDTVAYSLNQNTEFVCADVIPSNIVSGSLVDLLQTNPGHRTYKYDIEVPQNGVSTNVILLKTSDIPDSMIVGDYICSANECIIPQIPPDLHNGLAERTCARILEALGDREGMSSVMTKIQDIENRQGNLLDNRVEGAPQKINARHSMLRYLGVGSRRRL